jgi:hypothetical protein
MTFSIRSDHAFDPAPEMNLIRRSRLAGHRLHTTASTTAATHRLVHRLPTRKQSLATVT